MVSAWWACKEIGNFGDAITPYIIRHFGKEVEHNNSGDHILMSGSILSESNENSIIIGSGFMSNSDQFKGAKSIELVRGVLSRNKLGVNCPVGDPALILPLIYSPNVSKRYTVGIVPHYVDYDLMKHWESDLTHVIDITNDVEDFIDQICECELIVTSSLHGLIAAHAYGIKAKWVTLSRNVAGDGFKFYDYLAGTNMSFIPQKINPKHPIELTGGECYDHNAKELYNIIGEAICRI